MKFTFIIVLTLISLLVTLILFHRNEIGVSVGKTYRLIDDRQDYIFIAKNRKVVVQPTIVDFYQKQNFIVGLKFPISFFSCDTNSPHKIRILNEKRYFILDIENGNLYDFVKRNKFERKLLELNILESISLDYSQFDLIWNKFSKLYEWDQDKFECKYFLEGSIEYKKNVMLKLMNK